MHKKRTYIHKSLNSLLVDFMLTLEVLPHEEFHALVESLLAEVGRELHKLLQQFVESGVEALAESRIAQDIDHPYGALVPM